MMSSRGQMTECVRCGLYFDYKRTSYGDPARCRYCGKKHTLSELNFKGTERWRSRIKDILSGVSEEAVQEKITELAGDERDSTGQYLYIAVSADDIYKIGISSKPQERISDVNSSNPTDVELLDTFELEDARVVEKELHRRFDSKNESGEWFRLTDETVEQLQKELTERAEGEIPETLADETDSEQTTLNGTEVKQIKLTEVGR